MNVVPQTLVSSNDLITPFRPQPAEGVVRVSKTRGLLNGDGWGETKEEKGQRRWKEGPRVVQSRRVWVSETPEEKLGVRQD